MLEKVFYNNKNECKITTENHIDINTDNPSIFSHSYRTIVKDQIFIKEKVEKLEQDGIIMPSKSQVCSPLVLVKKRDGSKRICVDYRKLNGITIKEALPRRKINDALDHLCAAKIFSKIDRKSGYCQVPVKKSDL